ncbi:MAG: hypothetical protein C0423_22130 [Methylibium sp.]|nr:hypothetical protein [Methylibium sp.]
MEPARSSLLARPSLRRWALLLTVLAAGWAGVAAWLKLERDQLYARETAMLQTQARTLDSIVSQQLDAARGALDTISSEFAGWDGRALQQQAEPLLGTLAKAMPGIRVLSIVDAQGIVRASSAPQLIGIDASQRDFHLAPRQQPQPQRIFVSAPFTSALGAYTMTLSRALLDTQGRFTGSIAISLDPRYFRLVLDSARSDMQTWSALVHSDGLLFSLSPHADSWLGRNLLSQPNSLLERHQRGAADASVIRGFSLVSQDERLVALRTVHGREIGADLDKPLVVAVGRSVTALEAPWQRQRNQLLSSAGLLSLGAIVGMLLWQRRIRLVEAMRLKQRQLEADAAQRMALALDGAALGLWQWQVDSGATEFDERWCAMLGYSREELQPSVQTWQQLLHPDDKALTEAALDDCLQGRSPVYTSDFRLRHRDGDWRWIHANGRVIERDAQGQALRMTGTHLDITAARQAQARLIEQARHTQAILDNMVDGVITIDVRGIISSFNPAASRIFGYSPEEVIGRNVSVLMPEPDASHHDGYLRNYMQGHQPRVIGVGRDVDGRRKSGNIFPMSLAVSRVEHQGEVMFIGLTRDITERKKAEAQIERLAFYDPLTSLPNRRLLLDRLGQALSSSQRSGRRGAILFIDLDNFKSLNDTHGHGMGDRLLLSIAQRLQSALRAQDSVARWGGDEFVVLLQDLGPDRDTAARHAEAAGEKLLRVLGQPHQLDEHVHHSTPSIGIVLWGDAPISSDELLKHADHAMYQAKAAGRNQLCFFDPVTQAAMAERTALEADLRLALEREQLDLHYQPQVDRDGLLIGAEALLRWRHPERGWISPAVFIPLAEQTGLISQLGEWVIEQACLRLWQWAGDAQLGPLTLAVNVSVHQFRQKGFLGLMQQQLARSGAPTEKLKLEITESALANDIESMIQLMDALRQQGLRLSLDDFGTGYSSLAYLKRLPLTQLKIDKSFVDDLLTDADDRAIAHAVIQLGENLGLNVLAEGVETEAQRQMLLELGCHAFQGYLFSRPLPLDAFITLARRWPETAA